MILLIITVNKTDYYSDLDPVYTVQNVFQVDIFFPFI